MSFAIFAIGSNDVVAMFIAASTPVFNISAISTKVIEMQGAISSSFVTLTISAAEADPKLTVLDPLCVQPATRQFHGAGLVNLGTASVLHVDGDHRLRSSV